MHCNQVFLAPLGQTPGSMNPIERNSGMRNTFDLRSLVWQIGLALVISLIAYAPTHAQISFTRITSGNPVDDGGISAGVVWGDYNNDGYYDLFVTNWQSGNNFLYLNDGQPGYSFTREISGDIVSEGMLVPYSSGACWGDYNNDGWLDMFVANQQNKDNFLYLNKGDSTFTKITGQGIVTDGGALIYQRLG